MEWTASSPDGKWSPYSSNESGRSEIPSGRSWRARRVSGNIQISNGGGDYLYGSSQLKIFLHNADSAIYTVDQVIWADSTRPSTFPSSSGCPGHSARTPLAGPVQHAFDTQDGKRFWVSAGAIRQGTILMNGHLR